jgi:hypothetical protein
MHPEILRVLTTQHGRDLREQAQRAMAGRTLRGLRRRTHPDDQFVVPDIPDYVDGSFRAGADQAADQLHSQVHSQVPAARNAA